MEGKETSSKQDDNKCNDKAKLKKRSLKDPSVAFTKAVIICDSSEISKSEEITYRPNNIVVELLKKDVRRYGKMIFPKLSSEQKIREELCLRFPILKKKIFKFASADQYGKLNFHESEEWSGRNLRRWLPGSSAMYLILERNYNSEEPLCQKQQTSTESNSSCLSFTAMSANPSNETLFSMKSNRPQRALLEFLSSPEKVKRDDIKRPKISCSLPRSYSFHSFTDPALLKTEPKDTNLKYNFPCRRVETSPSIRKRKQVTDKSDSQSTSSFSVNDHLYNGKGKVCKSRKIDPIFVQDVKHQDKKESDTNSEDGHLLSSRTTFSQQQLSYFKNEMCRTSSIPSKQNDKIIFKRESPASSVKEKDLDNHQLHTGLQPCSAKPSVIRWLSKSTDSPTKLYSLHDHHHQSVNLSDRKLRCSQREHHRNVNYNCNSSACDENPNPSSDEDNDDNRTSSNCAKHLSVQTNSCPDSGEKHELPTDRTSSPIRADSLNQQKEKSMSDEENCSKSNNRNKRILNDVPPYLVPCYMVPNPLHSGKFYRSMTSASFCIPNKEELSLEQGNVIARPFVMPFKGNVAFLPFDFSSPHSGLTPYGFTRNNLATTSGNVYESRTHYQRNEQCHDKPASLNVGSNKKVERTSLLQKHIRSIEEPLSSALKNEPTDLMDKFPCEIIPSNGSCKGGDIFVIVFKQSLQEELSKNQLTVKFGERKIDKLAFVNSYTIKGVIPESVLPGYVAVTIVTSNCELVGSSGFTYRDDFIDGLTKTFLSNKHGAVLLDFITSTLEQGHSKLQGKMADIMELLVYQATRNGVKTARDKILNSILRNQIKLSHDQDLYQDDVSHDGSHGDEEKVTNRAEIKEENQCETDETTFLDDDVYGKKISFLPSDGTVDKEELQLDDKEQNETQNTLHSPSGIKEVDNLALLSSIACRIQHDTPCNSDNSDRSSSPCSSQTSTTPQLSSNVTISNDCSSPGFHKKVFVLPPNSCYLPSQSELCKLRMSGSFYSKVHFDIQMNEDEVMKEIRSTFPNLTDLRLRLAMVDQTGKLVFHQEIWTGKVVRRKLRGNSVLYVVPIG